jgi:hypothetical protein
MSDNGSLGDDRVDMAEGHLRRVVSTLRLLDRATCDFEQWTEGREARSVLYEETNSLSSDQRREIEKHIAAIRAVLGRLKVDLQLQPSRREAARSIGGRCAILWEALAELEPQRLERYGPLSRATGQRLDTTAAELMILVEAIGRCVGR